MAFSLELPTIQNWSCHNCGGCCRQHEIDVTPVERQRILDQKWSDADGVPVGARAFVKIGSGKHRLAHRADGACVFLNEKGLCRIHAKFGEDAKPLPCRIYPYAFHPGGDGRITLGLRFSCPSVVANKGRAISEQRGELTRLMREVVPSGAEQTAPPMVWGKQRLNWPDTMRVVRSLRRIVADDSSGATLATRLVHALFLTKMLGRASFDKVRGSRIEELTDLLTRVAPTETVDDATKLPEPSMLARMQFRLIVAQYARHDTLSADSRGIIYRLSMVVAGARFTRGRGNTPALRDGLKSVPFGPLDAAGAIVPADAEATLARYFDVKLGSMHFAGPAFYDANLVEGFANLTLVYPLTLYIARWIALGAGREGITTPDVETALTIVDHPHGYSPALGLYNFRSRVSWLMDNDQIENLIGWYGGRAQSVV